MLGYLAVAPLKQVKLSARGANRGKRGLGANGEEWWCLRCVESLVKAVRQCEFELYPGPCSGPPAHSLMHWAQWIIPEKRVIPRYPDSFRLEAPYRYALEKWKAVILYNSQQERGAHFKPELPPHLSTPEQLYYGTDGRSLYLSKETRDMRGLMQTGEEAEISAADCQDVSLTEVLKRVGKIMDAIRRGRRELRLAKEREARAQAEQSPVKRESGVKAESAVKEESAINSTQFVFRPVSRRNSM